MKLEKLPHEEEGFKTYPVNFCGIPSYLMIPEISAKWNRENLFQRSLILRADTFEVVSSGWPKFFNYGEKPDCYPNPEIFKDWVVTEKIDGSLLILDYFNGQRNMRTRGTASYVTQNNAEDFEKLFEKYPALNNWDDEKLSLLFEIVTPNNVIVVRPEDIDFVFLGGVWKDTMQVMTVEEQFTFSKMNGLKTPKTYTFKNIQEMVELVKDWRGTEGVVLAYNNNQNRVKLKSDWYLTLHKIKSELNSENNLIEFYVKSGLPDYKNFYDLIEKNFDFEIAQQLMGQISKMTDAGKEVKRIIEHMKDFVNDIRNFETRKEQALAIMRSYGGEKNNRAGMVFTILDGNLLSDDQKVKLMYQVLKN